MDLVTVYAQCAGRRFDFDLFAGLAHVNVAEKHTGDEQAAEHENDETAADDGENPEHCVIAFGRRWLLRNRCAARRAYWCGLHTSPLACFSLEDTRNGREKFPSMRNAWRPKASGHPDPTSIGRDLSYGGL